MGGVSKADCFGSFTTISSAEKNQENMKKIEFH